MDAPTVHPPARAPIVPPLELRVAFRASGFRWLLYPSDEVEVWRGQTLVGSISGASIRLLLEHHLASAAIAATISRELIEGIQREPEPILREDRDRLRAARMGRGRHDAGRRGRPPTAPRRSRTARPRPAQAPRRAVTPPPPSPAELAREERRRLRAARRARPKGPGVAPPPPRVLRREEA